MLLSLRAAYAGVRRSTTDCDRCLSATRIVSGPGRGHREREVDRTKSASCHALLPRSTAAAVLFEPGRPRRRGDPVANEDAVWSPPVSAARHSVRDLAAS